jgi:hypothetical protein
MNEYMVHQSQAVSPFTIKAERVSVAEKIATFLIGEEAVGIVALDQGVAIVKTVSPAAANG